MTDNILDKCQDEFEKGIQASIFCPCANSYVAREACKQCEIVTLTNATASLPTMVEKWEKDAIKAIYELQRRRQYDRLKRIDEALQQTLRRVK